MCGGGGQPAVREGGLDEGEWKEEVGGEAGGSSRWYARVVAYSSSGDPACVVPSCSLMGCHLAVHAVVEYST